MNKDEKWMRIALNEANLAMDENEIPVGAVLVKNDKLIAQSHNRPINKNDPTAHAEIELLRKAGEQQKNYRLIGSTLYVTLEPCVMCLGAIFHARINKLFFAAYDKKTGACESIINLNDNKDLNHHCATIHGGILEKESKTLLQKFFKNKR